MTIITTAHDRVTTKSPNINPQFVSASPPVSRDPFNSSPFSRRFFDIISLFVRAFVVARDHKKEGLLGQPLNFGRIKIQAERKLWSPEQTSM